MNPTPPAGVTFHRFGIQPSGSSATLKSLPTFLEELGHNERVVDIMKIDVEGAEFATFADAGTMAALKKHGAWSVWRRRLWLTRGVRSAAAVAGGALGRGRRGGWDDSAGQGVG